MQQVSFEYATAKISDMHADVRHSATGRKTVEAITIDGRRMRPSNRFWSSIQSRFGFSNNIFKYFDHAEVFERISERSPHGTLSYTVEHDTRKPDGNQDTLLAAVNPKAVTVEHDGLMNLLIQNGLDVSNADYGSRNSRSSRVMMPNTLLPDGLNSQRDILTSSTTSDGGPGGSTVDEQRKNLPLVSYHNGIIRSVHTPRNAVDFQIDSDLFGNRFVMDTPIDGYGKPAIYLMLLRYICSNGAIGFAKAFRSDISLGKKETSFDFALTRAIEGFNSEEGFECIRNRYESATKSWASINEINKAYKILTRLHSAGEVNVAAKYLKNDATDDQGKPIVEGSPIFKSFHKMVGDIHKHYGLANLDALGIKRQRTLPTGAKVYDLMNFITEVSTHHTTPAGARRAQAFVGDLLSNEFDLEGTATTHSDWSDFLLKDEMAAESFAMAKR